MTRPATQWRPVTDDVVLYRAVIDHTARCEWCQARPGSCPFAIRLGQMAKEARDIVQRARGEQASREMTVRVGADTGAPTGPHCRAASLSGQAAVHMDCGRPPGQCACYCHMDAPPAQ
ncbi:hypothetical protein [Streptomyces globisporus]